MSTILFSDDVHINKKNYGSLYDFFDSREIDVYVPEKRPLPIDAFGRYTNITLGLAAWIEVFRGLNKDKLYEFYHKGVWLFDVCRSELLSLKVVDDNFVGEKYESDKELFDLLFECSRDDLITNISAVAVWLDFWFKETKKVPRLTHVAVFSGSLIYARSLIEVMRYRAGRVFVLESFFTGKHFYIEEKYSHIANNSDFSLPTIRRSLYNEVSLDSVGRKTFLCQSLLSKKNKNVVQPVSTGERLFSNGKPTLLILGQVVNDFSLIGSNPPLYSLSLYRQLISDVLDRTDFNVVFKGHPWELKKNNVMCRFTLDYLSTKFSCDNRLKLVQDYSIDDLFDEVDSVCCLNSQSGIDAALSGFKPIQIGNAFWGGAGFSYDLSFGNTDSVVELLLSGEKLKLDLSEYAALEEWLGLILTSWLIPESGDRFRRLPTIFDDIEGKKVNAIELNKDVVSDLVEKKVSDRLMNIYDIQSCPSETKLSRVVSDLPKRIASSRKKLIKLKRSPYAFMRDSSFSILRIIARISK